MSALEQALAAYIRRGWAVVPIPPGRKGPCIPEWEKRQFAAADFAAGDNVGVKQGVASGGIVDVDLDCPEALALADLYLPTTRAEFGRASKPRSHRLYVAADARFQKFIDPISSGTLLELRADSETGGVHQTLFPPSIADNERREWCGDIIAPIGIDHRILRRRCDWLAIGCLVMRYVSETAARRPGPDLPRLLWELDHALGRRAYEWLGQPAPDSPRHNLRPRSRLSRDEIDLAELVAAIPNDCGWEDWNRIGMAIFAASGGSSQGGVVFDDFSGRSPKYNPYTTADRWQNYRRSPPSKIGIGTLVYLARQHGWRPSRERTQ